MAKLTSWRIRIVDHLGNTSFLVRKGDANNGDVTYKSADEIPLALSNMFGNGAAEIRFKLEDTQFGSDAVKIVRDFLTEKWKGNPSATPKVTNLV